MAVHAARTLPHMLLCARVREDDNLPILFCQLNGGDSSPLSSLVSAGGPSPSKTPSRPPRPQNPRTACPSRAPCHTACASSAGRAFQEGLAGRRILAAPSLLQTLATRGLSRMQTKARCCCCRQRCLLRPRCSPLWETKKTQPLTVAEESLERSSLTCCVVFALGVPTQQAVGAMYDAYQDVSATLLQGWASGWSELEVLGYS